MHLTFLTKPTATGSKYTTRLQYGPDFTPEELDAHVAAVTGLTADKCRAVGRQYFLEILNSPTPRRCLRLFDLFRIAPTSGGSATTPEGFIDATGLKASIAVSFAAEIIADWRQTCTIEKAGDEGVAAPEIDSVLNVATDVLNTYTAEQMVRIIGEDLEFDRNTAPHGVFLGPTSDGPWVRLNTYGTISEANVSVLIPAGTTGPRWLKVINSRGHMSVYTTPIAP